MMRLANCFKLVRLERLVIFVRNFQKTKYRSTVLFLLMTIFAIAAHWFICIFHFIAILERPNLQVKYSWLDHLTDKYKILYPFLNAPTLRSVTTIIIKLYQDAEELKEMKQCINGFIKYHRISKQLAK
ncbi:unnamed protein product [Rotaria sp. Silwood2]|nr:unnamed protein product [Rotaria sp. Silwood2]